MALKFNFKNTSLTLKTLGVIVITLISKMLGFIRTAVIAAIYGATWQTDAFNMALSVLCMLSGPTGSLTLTIVPMRIKILVHDGKEEADRFVSSLLSLIVVISAFIGIAAFLFTPQIVRVFAPSFSEETFNLTVSVTRIFTPLILISGICSVLTGILNAHKRFFAANLIPLIQGILWLLIPLFLSRYFGIFALVAGYGIGTALQIIFYIPALKEVYHFFLLWNWKDSRIKEMLIFCLPIFIGTFSGMINMTIDRALASSLAAGSVSALQYASQLTSAVIGIIINPICTSIFTSLSEYVQSGNIATMKNLLMRAINLICLMILPITLISLIMPYEIVYTIFQRGMFDEHANLMTRTAFSFYALSLLPNSILNAFNKCFYAIHFTKGPLLIGILGVCVNIILNLVLVRIMGISGIALATTVSMFVMAGTSIIIMRKKIGPLGLGIFLKSLVKIGIASFAVIVSAYTLQSVLTIYPIVKLIVTVIISGIAYLIILICVKHDETVTYVRMITAKISKR